MSRAGRNRRLLRNRLAGVTLIELMVVLAVVAILGSLATTSYRRYMLRSNRTDAMTALLQIQVAQEKFFLQNNSYATTVAQAAAPPPGGLGVGITAGGVTTNGFYVVTFSNATATTYTATATATGAQVQDTTCPSFSINESGLRTPATSTRCWR